MKKVPEVFRSAPLPPGHSLPPKFGPVKNASNDQQAPETGGRQYPAIPAKQIRPEEKRDTESAEERCGHRMQPEHPSKQNNNSGKRVWRTATPVCRKQRKQPADERQ